MQDVLDLEAIAANIESLSSVESRTADEQATLQNQLSAVNKALTYAKDKEQRLFEKGISVFQGYLDDTDLSITNCGTRRSKLSLIKSRLQNQKTTFETLKSNNEDVDITEVAINLTSASLTYQAALMATGKVTQTTLLNYI
jgi:flagellar hook-associated protein 3 FlgL